MNLPVTTLRLRDALHATSMANRMPMSVELLLPSQPTRDPPLPGARDFVLNVTGWPIERALSRLLSEPIIDRQEVRYVWHLERGIARVKPAAFDVEFSPALSLAVPQMDEVFANPITALRSVVKMLMPEYTVQEWKAPQGPGRGPAVLREPIQVVVVNGTVRDVLDEIVRKLGGGSWGADYLSADGAANGLSIRVDTFSNIHLIVRVPIR